MGKQSRKFWDETFRTSRYLWLGIVLSVVMLFWTPAFPYFYLGLLGGFLQFVFDVTFYRQASRPQVFAFIAIFLLNLLSLMARDLYSQPNHWLFRYLLLPMMLVFAYLGVRALLFLIFQPAIVKRIGLKN